MATISGGNGNQIYVNLGSNDVSGFAQALVNTVIAGLANGTFSVGANRSGAGGSVSVTSTAGSVYNAPGTDVNILAAGSGTTTVVGAGGANHILIGDNENIVYNTGGGSGSVITGDGNNLIANSSHGQRPVQHHDGCRQRRDHHPGRHERHQRRRGR